MGPRDDADQLDRTIWDSYSHLEEPAYARLRVGAKSDWPTLAADMALDAESWSDDMDFFEVGVPLWSTPNVDLAPPDRRVRAVRKCDA